MKRKQCAPAILFMLLLSVFALGCGGNKTHMTSAPSNPAATGTVDTSTDDNGNTRVDLKVYHLAQPNSLTPAKSTYVVWIQPQGKEAESKGVIKVDHDLSGEFKTVSPYKQFDIFITAEDGPSVSTPSGQEVLRQTVGK